MAWTANDIPSQSGRTAIVTGANSGIGYRAALELARHDAHVILACRNQGRGDEAAKRISAELPRASVQVRLVDMSDLTSVRAFASGITNADLLVNNAGVMAVPRGETADGFELQFGTNHLGHFALTGLLLPVLSGDARVVTISSMAANIGLIRFGDLQSRRLYQPWLAYGQSKLANQMFAFELDRRAKAAGLGLKSMAAHPGYAATNLGAGVSGGNIMERLIGIGDRVLAQSDEAGALPTLYASCAPSLHGGEYIGPDFLFGMRGAPTIVAPVWQAKSQKTRTRLWEVSEKLTGVTYL